MPQALSLPAELTIYTISALHPLCLAWLDDAGPPQAPLRLDAAAVAEVDAAGLQLLQSLANALALRQRRLELVNPSPPMSSACAALGVAALLAPATPDVSLPTH
jgi:anti-anti-sigma regulatory factor